MENRIDTRGIKIVPIRDTTGNTFYLPFKQYIDESVLSYLMRIADAYRITLYDILKFNLNKIPKAIPKYIHVKNNTIMDNLKKFNPIHTLNFANWVYSLNLIKDNLIIDSSIKICPLCWKEKQYLRNIWSLKPYLFCKVHLMPLISHCKRCDRSLIKTNDSHFSPHSTLSQIQICCIPNKIDPCIIKLQMDLLSVLFSKKIKIPVICHTSHLQLFLQIYKPSLKNNLGYLLQALVLSQGGYTLKNELKIELCPIINCEVKSYRSHIAKHRTKKKKMKQNMRQCEFCRKKFEGWPSSKYDS